MILSDKKTMAIQKKRYGSLILSLIIIEIFFYAGSAFSQKAVTRDNFYCVTIVDDQAWAAGYHGSIIHFKEKEGAWTIQPSGTPESLFAISFINVNRGWIAGQSGTILSTADGGKSWNLQKSNTGNDLFGVHFIDKNHGWACGIMGTVLSTSDGGKNWEKRSLPEDVDLYSIFFIDHQQGWAAGEFGVILHTIDGGKSWTKQPSPIEISPVSGKSQCLFKIRFADQLKGWATGIDGQILQTVDGGRSWELLQRVTRRHLFGLTVAGESFVAVGAKGEMVDGRYDSLKARCLSTVDFNGIAIKGKLGLIVGNTGITLTSSDEGRTWKKAEIVISQKVRTEQ